MTLTRVDTLLAQRNCENASYIYLNTPKKAKIRQAYQERTAINFYGLQSGNLTIGVLIQQLDVSRFWYYRAIRSKRSGDDDRILHNQEGVVEPRGRPRKIISAEIHEMERIIEKSDAIGRSIIWEALGHEAGIKDVSRRTIQRIMGRMDYHKCVACTKTWIGSELAQKRCDYASFMLDKYSFKYDWWHVRFSDKVHFGIGLLGKLMIIRKPGERYCINCI